MMHLFDFVERCWNVIVVVVLLEMLAVGILFRSIGVRRCGLVRIPMRRLEKPLLIKDMQL